MSELQEYQNDEFYLSWWNDLPDFWVEYFTSKIKFNDIDLNEDLIDGVRYIIHDLDKIYIYSSVFNDDDERYEIQYLEKLEGLVELNINISYVDDFDRLGNLENLKRLHIQFEENLVDDIGFISGLSNLEELYIKIYSHEYNKEESKPLDLSPVCELFNLNHLEIQGDSYYSSVRKIEINLPAIMRITKEEINVTSLKLINLNLKYYYFIRDFSNLTDLYIEDRYMTSLSFLSENKKLEKLSLKLGCERYHIDEIRNLKRLRELDLHYLKDCGSDNTVSLRSIDKLKILHSLSIGHIWSNSRPKIDILDLDSLGDSKLSELKIPFSSNLFKEDKLRKVRAISSIYRIIIE